jgi:hypothetical protein
MYKIDITITNEKGDELLVKRLPIKSLDGVLDVDLAVLYAEAQQNEIFDTNTEYDDSDEYRESTDL